MATLGLSLDSDTVAPPAGAGPVSLTVPLENEPPVMLQGFKVTAAMTGDFTVRVAVCEPL